MKSIYKAVLSVSAAAVVMAGTLTPAMVMAWGDSDNGRPSYTLEQVNNGALKDTITFNSISNGKIGDEKNFVGAKVAGANVQTWNANTIKVKDGETYTIRLFVHNNSPRGMQAIAKGVKATFSIPTTVAKSQTIYGYLDSSNAKPSRIWDEVILQADENVYLEYVDGSAKFNNNKGVFNLSDNVIHTGATLGYTSMNGEIPGCYEYSGVVTIDVKVHSSVAAKLSKKVRLKGTTAWSEYVYAKVGDEVEYQIEYVNLLTETVNNVTIRDILPDNVEYVMDSTYLYNSNYQNGIKLDNNTVTTSGINIGSHNANGNSYVRFTGKVVDNDLSCGNNQLVNWANVIVDNNKSLIYKDDASVMVVKDGDVCKDQPTPTPTPEPTPDTPETIVDTGAGTIVTGAIGAGSVVTTLGYFIASRKKM